jgi:DNA repair protein RecN (Recombination protein N)
MVVGEKLWQLGRQHQVLCVTHLPQLAAFGDNHFGVRKVVAGGRTVTKVEKLKDASLLNELTEMLGGATDENREAAQKTLAVARERVGELAKAS